MLCFIMIANGHLNGHFLLFAISECIVRRVQLFADDELVGLRKCVERCALRNLGFARGRTRAYCF